MKPKLGQVGGLFLVCWTSTIAWPASSSDNWLARSWRTDEGLPNNSVTGVAQAADGYLWVSTLDGFVRFNGEKFENLSLAHIGNVSTRRVRKMFLDRQQRLWLVTAPGVVLCLETNSARVFRQQDGLEVAGIRSIAEDPAGAVWLATDHAFYRVHEGKVSRFGPEQGMPPGESPWIGNDANGNLWCARGAEIGAFRDGKWEKLLRLEHVPVCFCAARDGLMWICAGASIIKYTAEGEPRLQARLPDKLFAKLLFEDQQGLLWIGTAGGLFCLSGDGLERVETSHHDIYCGAEDREGNIWIGTDGGGLNRLRPKAIELIGTKQGLPAGSLRSVCQDKEGWLWIAMNDGSVVRGRSNQWNTVVEPDELPGDALNCVTAAPDGGVWMHTRQRGLQLWRDGQFQDWEPGQEISSSQDTHMLLMASNGELWFETRQPKLICLRKGEFHAFDLPAGVQVIRALAEGRNGTIWAATADSQVLRVKGSAAAGDSVVRESSFPPIPIRCLHTAPDGSLWSGYAGTGLGRLWNGHFVQVSTKEGLQDNNISQIQSDNQGGLWFTSYRSLFRARLEDLEAVTEGRAERVRVIDFGRSEGLPKLEPFVLTGPNSWRSSDGQLWFATRSGLLHVRPDRIRDRAKLFPAVIERVTVDDRTVALRGSRTPLCAGADTNPLEDTVDLLAKTQTLRLSPGHRKVAFEFAALNITLLENVSVRYRLNNFDADWVAAGSQRVATYPQLRAGGYEFQVQTRDPAGDWHPAEPVLTIKVPPFFWQTLWFRLGALATATILLVAAARYRELRRLQFQLVRVEQQAAIQKERARIAEDLHDDLGAGLTEIGLLAALLGNNTGTSGEQEHQALERIVQRTRHLVTALDEIVWAVNPRNDSARSLGGYFCHYAQEFFKPTGIRCRLSFREGATDAPLNSEQRHNLFLAFKEALTNVARHSGATEVKVSILLEAPGSVEVLVQDNGHGLLGAMDEGADGLINLRQRMERLAGQCEFRNLETGGLEVKLRAPLVAPLKNNRS